MTRRLLLIACLTLLLLAGCSKKSVKNPIATIEMIDGGNIVVELDPSKAPNTVANFVALANEGFYDGLIFHRVSPGFVIQGGDPEGTGSGGPNYSIKGEFASNGFSQNDLKHTRGTISMARSGIPDSAGSQFFIVLQDAENLDGKYAAFGHVTEGMDVVDRIAQVELNGEKPLTPQTIKQIRVETFGETYKPNVIK